MLKAAQNEQVKKKKQKKKIQRKTKVGLQAHQLVEAPLLFCRRTSRRFMVLMDFSFNGDRMQVFIQEK